MPSKHFYLSIVLLFTIFVQYANAQKDTTNFDSVALSTSRFFYLNPYEVRIQNAFHVNYDIDNCSQADPILKFNRDYYAHMGDVGHSHLSLFFHPEYNSNFIYQPSVLTAYLFTPENIKFYQVQKPYTELQYFSSFGDEYFFNATHTQNIFPNWNIALEDHLISAKGYYANSSVINNYLNLSSHYFSKNGRYRLKAGFIYNYSKMQENGGIKDDSLFTQNIQTNRSAIPVNLDNASTKLKEINTFLNHSFSIHKPDTGYTKKSPFNLGVIGQTIQFQRKVRVYSENSLDSGYYMNTYLDTTKTYDSIGYWKLQNTFFWTNDVYRDHEYLNPVKLTFGIQYQFIHLNDVLREHRFAIISPIAKANFNLGHFNLNLSGELSLSDDYNNGGYITSGELSYKKEKHEVQFQVNLKRQESDYFYSTYYSNHFIWNTDFSKESIFNTSLIYTWNKNIILGATLYQYRDAVFLDENITPYQHSATESLFQIYTKDRLNWNIFRLDNFAAIQFSSNDDVFRLPVFELKQTYSVNFHLFKKHLQVQTGFDIYYNTSYFGDAYSPALASFYRQNDIKTGNNIWVDFFASGKIKRAFVFMRLCHLNALFTNNPTYYMIPHYPTQDFEFKFGLIWKFFS